LCDYLKTLVKDQPTPTPYFEKNRTKEGRIIDVQVDWNYKRDKKGHVVGFISVITDITERKQAEAKLIAMKDRLDNVIESSLDCIIITDTEGKITRVNKSFLELTGYNEEEAMGKHIYEFAPTKEGTYESTTGELVEITEKFFNNAKKVPTELFETGKIKNRESFFVRKDGEVVPVETNISLLYNEKQDVIGTIAIRRDITERRKAEKEIQEAKNFLELIFKTSVDGLIVVNPEGRIIMASDAVEDIFGYSKDELLDKTTSVLRPKGDTYLQEGKEFIEKLFEDGYVRGVERIGKRKDETLIDLEINSVLLKDSKGNYLGRVASFKDITERKRAEKELIEHQNQLRFLASQITLSEERERRHLADCLHDEIGQQLFGIKIKLEMLKDSLSSTEDATTLDNVLNNIEQVIGHARSLTIELSPPILYELGFEKALEWLAEQTHNNYGIMVAFADDKREKPLDDDVKIFLYQAVRELLTNVVKHAQVKNARVSVKKDNTNIRICCEDDGVGFTHSHKSSSKDGKKGFGLFSIKERLDYLGGHLEIESQPNRGTHITLVAPLSSKVGGS
jgi:PAS domain S-box-containing protein